MKSISETYGTVKNKSKKILDKDIKDALVSASLLMREVMSTQTSSKMTICLDLKRKLELIEREYGISLI